MSSRRLHDTINTIGNLVDIVIFLLNNLDKCRKEYFLYGVF